MFSSDDGPCDVQNIKIGDFGMSRFVGGQAAAEAAKMPVLRRGLTCNVIGTAHYASPELLNDELLVRRLTPSTPVTDAHDPCMLPFISLQGEIEMTERLVVLCPEASRPS